MRPHAFQTTRWTLVERVNGAFDAEAAAALAALCNAYWYPIYAFIRRSGHTPHDAEDLTQGFFARLLEQERITDGNRERFSALRPARESAPLGGDRRLPHRARLPDRV
jgi:RNA polymerase sigma-70 factor (ECF subfamily)